MEIWSPESVLSHVPPGSKNEKVAEGRHEITVFCSQGSVDARVSVVHGYYVVVNEFSQTVLVGDIIAVPRYNVERRTRLCSLIVLASLLGDYGLADTSRCIDIGCGEEEVSGIC